MNFAACEKLAENLKARLGAGIGEALFEFCEIKWELIAQAMPEMERMRFDPHIIPPEAWAQISDGQIDMDTVFSHMALLLHVEDSISLNFDGVESKAFTPGELRSFVLKVIEEK
jgi:hypothetical protein